MLPNKVTRKVISVRKQRKGQKTLNQNIQLQLSTISEPQHHMKAGLQFHESSSHIHDRVIPLHSPDIPHDSSLGRSELQVNHKLGSLLSS
ncbi:hypothetical protein VIGAN_03149100 [Vigna angularis var. angularis]|uniref:Uncharacterized protein n=1 Tax=Vigna angularis var. angularis TaxID=157739 RepID=A0A0S3RME2_PHAAN|nr:hypothetical protein VIGAN_03149100 [Vigna angularis var. angularis]